ncbi:MAG: O-antigen ligase family protein [Flavobacteriales bacterium]|nr:O-antigen ligase family protein [Flavobacteriales bacterium]
MPWSTAYLSMAQMLLAANWIAAGIVEGNARARWRAAFAQPPVLMFMSFFGLHLLGLFWTEDLGWGLDLCRILFPVLVLGAVLSGSERLRSAELRTVLLLGAWSAIASGLFGLFFSGARADDYRGISMFVSHIRLALMLCMAIAVLLWYRPKSMWLRPTHWIGAGIAAYLILRLTSIQGLLILALIGMVYIWRAVKPWRALPRIGVRALLLLVPLLATVAAFTVLESRNQPVPAGLGARMERTAGGEPYHHDTINTQTENGTHVWTYIAWNELRRAWLLRSTRSLDDVDDRGHPLWATTVRYLASKGMRKDSAAVMKLSDGEVRAIESGIPNVLHGQRGPIRERLEEVLFELDQYRGQGVASGHSVAMRIEFAKAGWAIAKANWMIGVGTGDTQRAFDALYELHGSSLEPRWRLRAHNEYLTLWISFGVFGLLWSLFSWWWPAWRLGAWRNPLFVAWAIAFGISCFTDDTIETQAGATFFALYYALFVFAAPVPEDSIGTDITTASGASRT